MKIRFVLILIVAFTSFFNAASLSAHEIKPIVSTLDLSQEGQFKLQIELNAEALASGLRPSHKTTQDQPEEQNYKALRKLDGEALKNKVSDNLGRFLAGINFRFDGKRILLSPESVEIPEAGDLAAPRITRIILAGDVPEAAANFSWKMAAEFGSNVVKVRRAEGEPGVFWLRAGASLPPMAVIANSSALSMQETVVQYIEQGYIHILPMGLDHILFVLGLFLLSPKMKPLLIQVTLFTLAHSITLGLAAAGIVSLSAAVVEPLIALSIAYVAIENVMAKHLGRFRMLVVMIFGLLHGLGFASVLSEVGLPESQFLSALFSFNIGVEFGQLTVILAAYLLLGVWKGGENRLFYGVQKPASWLIASIGLYWFLERIGLLEGILTA